MQLKGTESETRKKRKHLLNEFKGFKYVMTLAWKLRKIENDNETKYSTIYLLRDVFESSVIRLYQIYKYQISLDMGFLSWTVGEGGGYSFNLSLPLPPTSQTLRN